MQRAWRWILHGGLCLLACQSALGRELVRLEIGDTTRAEDEALACVFERLQQPYQLEKVPRRRALHDLLNQAVDGYFPALQQPELDRVATLSAPLALEKWYWVGLDQARLFGAGFPSGERIGAVAGSNQELWLQQSGLPVEEQVNSPAQLLPLLQTQRLDTFLVDLRQGSTDVAGEHPYQPLYIRFARYAPLGVYFSRRVTQREPAFIDQFNRQLEYCQTSVSALNENERRRLLQQVETHVRPWSRHPVLTEALEEGRRMMPDEETRARRDAHWRDASGGPAALAEEMLARPASRFLALQQERSAGIITEVMLVDARGHNVAISSMTSDYWQGDEDKFIRLLESGDGVAIGDIHYDPSTRRFVAHASLRLAGSTGLLGALIVGISVEQALAGDVSRLQEDATPAAP